MDWQAILDVALSDGVNAKRVDFMSNALIQLIPDDPNETADWLWLKQRGWECFLETWSLPGTELNWYRGYLRCGQAQLDLDPSRMTVALFEAAAMEAMKHGE